MTEKIDILKKYFSQQSEVIIVFLFGSYTKKQQTPESDLDIAIYFKPKEKAVEWEEIVFYPEEDRIWGEVEQMMGVKTDLIILNRASSTLAFSIIQEGIPLIIKDYSVYLRFFLLISSAAEYFNEWINDFWQIKQRSLSLSEIDKTRLIQIIDFLETELIDYPQFIDIDQLTYNSNSALRRNVERWVENIINASLDIAKILLASQRKRIPSTYRQVMEELALIPNFKVETAQTLSQFVKMRNILAHEYVDIRFPQIKQFLQKAIPSYQNLLSFVKDLLNQA